MAKRAVGRLQKLLRASASVEEHLADQLLLPMVLAGKGSFTTTKPSLHTITNIDVIKQFGITGLVIKQLNEKLWCLEMDQVKPVF